MANADKNKNIAITQNFVDKLLDKVSNILKEQYSLKEVSEEQAGEIESLLNKISSIERDYEELTKSLARGSYPLKLARSIKVESCTIKPQINPIAIATPQLVSTYNEIPALLLGYINPVCLTPDSYRGKNTTDIILETTIKGNYWAIATVENKEYKYWLVPNSNLKFNIYKLKTIESLFQLKGDYTAHNSEFILQEPAILSLLPDNRHWKLIKPGILFFGDRSTLSSQLQPKKNRDIQKIFSDLKRFQKTIDELDNKIALVSNKAQSSNVRLIPSRGMAKVQDLLILDPNLAEAWGKSPQDIWIHQDETLASLRIEDLKSGKTIWQNVRWVESKDLFLPELTFIDIEDALPGAFLPEKTQPLIFNKRRITPLLPLNPILLEYFAPEDLIGRINVMPFNSSDGAFVRIELDLPLSGINNQAQNHRIYQDYPLKEQNALADGVPILEVWPNFQAEGWQEYYGFYYDVGLGEDTFGVSFPHAKEPHIFKQGRGNYQLTKLEKFPSFIQCHDSENQDRVLGLILLKTPPKIDLTGDWRVGVDFGTSFTNIYVNRKGTVEPLSLETLHRRVTEADIETRTPVLFEYFIPENFVPLEKPLPLENILTTRGKTNCPEGKERALFDGRIYIPDNSQRFKPTNDWIEIIKWGDWLHCRLFLEHLAIIINAIAASKGIREIQWSLSYPSIISEDDCQKYTNLWQDITASLEKRTGIRQICPEHDNLDYLRSEHIAFAQYFADDEEYDLARSTCIKIDNDISNISIWENNQLVHQCSVRLAGRQLISQFFEVNIDFLCKSFEENPQDWKGLKQERFYAKLDVLLRHKGDTWLRDRIRNFDKDPEFQGLIRLIALGTAGIYYYVGILLKVLHAEGKYSAEEITLTYVGGNASYLLNWLDSSGIFDCNSEVNELFSYMISRGSDFEDTEELTRLSRKPKDEVACGLVLSDTSLKELNRRQKDPLIAGEVCEINGEQIEYDSRLEWGDTIKDFKIHRLDHLFTFVDEFNLGIQELDLEYLKPMFQHQKGTGLEPEYKEKLYRSTRKELNAMLLREFSKGDTKNICLDAPFILGLKALLQVLAKE